MMQTTVKDSGEERLRSLLLERRYYLEELTAELKKRILAAPKGRLRCTVTRGIPRYYHRLDPKDTSGVYLNRSKQKTASDLAQKEYDEKVLRAAETELKLINECLGFYSRCMISDIFPNLTPLKRHLVKPVTISDDAFVSGWRQEPYERKGFAEDAPQYYSARGERVRSKTEILIADALDRKGIPYRYEYPLELSGGRIIYPDFLVLNVRERKEIYWEHLGLMDELWYIDHALRRIEHYADNGIYPGDRLIMTHETSERPLKTKVIDNVIKHYLE